MVILLLLLHDTRQLRLHDDLLLWLSAALIESSIAVTFRQEADLPQLIAATLAWSRIQITNQIRTFIESDGGIFTSMQGHGLSLGAMASYLSVAIIRL